MTSEGDFIKPPPFGTVGDYSDLPSYGIDTTVKLEWTLPSDDNVTSLWLVQDNVEGTTCEAFNWANTACTLILTGNRGISWDWPIQEPDGYLVSSPIYWLSMRNAGDSFDNLFASHYFNILPQSLLAASSSSSSTTVSAAISQGMSTTSSTTAAVITSNVSTSPLLSLSTSSSSSSSSSPQTSSSSSSDLTKMVIGVAVGVGIPLIAILVAIVFLLRKNYKNKTITPTPDDAGHIHHSSNKNPLVTTTELPHGGYADYGTDYNMRKPQELSEQDGAQNLFFPLVELDAGQRITDTGE